MNEALRNVIWQAWGTMFLATAAVVAYASFGFAAEPRNTRAVSLPNAAVRPMAPPPASGDRRDVLLLLDDGPLHLRLNVALGGLSLVESRRQVVNRLMESLDKDKDGK